MLARLVVEKGLATQEEVAACEQEQRRIAEAGDYKPLEEILTERGVLSATDAAAVAHEADYRVGRSEDEELAQLAADEGIIPREHLDECLDEQAQEFMISGQLRRLGAILVAKGYATPQTSVRILEARERREKERAAAGEKPHRPSTAMIPAEPQQVQAGAHDDQLFAKLAVQKNYVTREKLQECLEEQAIAKRYGQYVFVGDLLRDKGFISKDQYQNLLRLEEVTLVLQQDMLFAKVGLQIKALKREDVDAALNAQREAVRDGAHPPPRIGELLFKAGVLSPEDSIKILETTEKLADKLQKKKDKWAGREQKVPDLGPLPDKRKPDRVLANLAFRKKVLDRTQILEAFREQEVVERYGQAIPLEKILAGKKLIAEELLEKLVKYRDRGLVICTGDDCDGFIERRKQPQGQTAKCPKCGLLLETEAGIEAPRPRAVPLTVAAVPAAAPAAKPTPKAKPAARPKPEATPAKAKPAARKSPSSKGGKVAPPPAELPLDQTIDMPAPTWDEDEPVDEDDGDKLGEYKIVREIGRGAMGVVYEAIQESLNRRVALKVLLDDFTLDQGSIDRFKREAESAAKLHHENIVPIFDVGEIDDVNYYAMEFVEGRTLDQLLTEESLTVERAAKIAVQIARALDYAHQKGVIHRDIKPANVMVDSADRVHLMDFGLAKQKGMNTITATDALLGTPMYMSPEQATQRGRVTGKSDVYALGVTLYESLTLEPPFRGDNFAALVVQIRDVSPPKPSRVNSKVPPALDRIALKAMAKKPDERYATAGAMADDLERFLHGEKVQAKAPRRRPGWLVPVAVVAVLGLAGGGAFVALGGLGPSGPSKAELDKERKRQEAKQRREKARALYEAAAAARLAREPDWEEVIPPLDAAIELVGDDMELRAARAEALLARSAEGDATRALTDARRAAEARSDDASLQLLLAQAALGAGDTGTALAAANAVLDLLADASERAQRRQRQQAWLVIGDARVAERQFAKAKEAYRHARDVTGLVAPGEALFGHAWMLVELEEWDEALATLKELDRNLPDWPGAHLLAGRACQALGKLDDALEEYQKEGKGPPDRWNADAAERAAALQAELATRDPYATATPSDQATADAYNQRGVGYFRQGDGYRKSGQRQRAEEFYKKAASDFGKAADKGAEITLQAVILANRCMALARLGDKRQLERDGMRAVTDGAKVATARWVLRGAFIEALNDPALLQKVCDAVLAADAARADVLVLRAECKIALRRTEEALADADRAYELNPRMDGVPGMRGLIVQVMANRAADAESRKTLLEQARDLLREAEGASHEYRREAVQRSLGEVQRALGG